MIDESYDSIEDSQLRWKMAFDQVIYLCQIDQKLILEKIRPIVEYNYDLLWTTDWRNILDQQVLASIGYAVQTE